MKYVISINGFYVLSTKIERITDTKGVHCSIKFCSKEDAEVITDEHKANKVILNINNIFGVAARKEEV